MVHTKHNGGAVGRGRLATAALLLFLLLSMGAGNAFAQGVISTPITRLGYGELEDSSPVGWKGMGGVGIGMNSNKVINLKNPAAFAATDSLSFLFDIGASVNMGHYRAGENKKTTFLGGIDYIAIQLPLYKDKLALSAGLVPLSHAGYGLVSDVEISGGEELKTKMQQSFSGKGSLQAVYAGLGVRLWEHLYLGANVKYLFGKLKHTVHTVPNSTVLSQTYSEYMLRLSNFTVDFGAQYRFLLPGEMGDNLLLGATYAPQMRLSPQLFFTENKNYGSADKPVLSLEESVGATATPHKIGVGFSWSRPGVLVVAGDFSTQLWSKVPNIFEKDHLTLKDSYSAAVGVEFQPDRYSRRFSDRMYYRMGLNYGSSYFEAPQLGARHRIGASLGIGLPITSITTDRSSHVNITLGYERSFSQLHKSMTQDVLKLSLGFTFNETWFRKLKIY